MATGLGVLLDDPSPSGLRTLFTALLTPSVRDWRKNSTTTKQRRIAMTIRMRFTRSNAHLLHRSVHDNGGCNAIRKAPPFIDGVVSS